jgi:methionyl-tRNA formyltransferase
VSIYVVVSSKPWSRRIFDETISTHPGRWEFLDDRGELTEDRLAELAPRYVFFLHWSWLVPPAIVNNFECVCFHMTDLPFGRGGTPLQNLIVRGFDTTVLTAFRMTEQLDAGPVYLKRPLSLDGSADEIYLRATETAARMIEQIVADEPDPVAQKGEATVFTRRTPDQSEITPEIDTLARLHDHIRMLDADGYPHAFLRVGALRFTFTSSTHGDGFVRAEVEITRDPMEE